MKKRAVFINGNYGQISVFVIIGILIVAGIGSYFLFDNFILNKQVPAEFKEVYDYYLSCVENIVKDGASILGTQAGHLDLPNFEAGSDYSPFSSQLDFMGFAVPYWYYISGNGVAKEQIPVLSSMENQLENYLEEKIKDCDLSGFVDEGYLVVLDDNVKANVEIEDNKINAQISQNLKISKGEGEDMKISQIKNHKLTIDSKLGRFYALAKQVYDSWKEKMFLENYARDVLYLYAPVSGVEISCEPKVWNAYDVINDLKQGLNVNLQMVKIAEKKDYYDVDIGNVLGTNEKTRFIYSPSWPSRFEVWPTKSEMMIASPIGNQPGLGALGFCYIPYKFVYDMYFPVLIQIADENAQEIFQFPVAIVIDKNQIREAIEPQTLPEVPDVCSKSNTKIRVYTYDVHLNPVEANIKFKCLTDTCALGKTKINDENKAVLEADSPQCVNAIITASAEGYKDEDYTISTNQEERADIFLTKLYDLDLEVYVNGVKTTETAMVILSDNSNNKILEDIAYPYKKEVKIAEGDYKVELKVFSDKKIIIPQITSTECVEVPKEDISALFGFTDEKCFEQTIPSQQLSNTLYAGGSGNIYLTEGQLSKANKLKINVEAMKVPTTMEEIGEVYDFVEINGLDIELG